MGLSSAVNRYHDHILLGYVHQTSRLEVAWRVVRVAVDVSPSFGHVTRLRMYEKDERIVFEGYIAGRLRSRKTCRVEGRYATCNLPTTRLLS